MIGNRVGGYEILSLLGTGGMGEVYRARDTKLGRDVAIKVVSSSFANDPDRLARMAREARLLAALNHPHIATIHGLEEADGVRALVMELVEGPTLAEKLEHRPRGTVKGGLPLEEALKTAGQIAEALEAAHEKGIVHRDLKPANLKLARDGHVKVLDFGLATAFSGDGTGSDLSQRPTITVSDVRAGMMAGTPAYMSPEQVRGEAIDARADVWAFGCVLFEMLTGRMAFAGTTVSDTIAAILQREPDWSAVPAATPPNVRHVLARCLEKDPKRRWKDIGDVRIELENVQRMPSSAGSVEHSSRGGRQRLAWAALVLVTAAAAALATAALRKAPAPAEVRFDVLFPREIRSDFTQLAISPDGQQLVVAPSFGGRAPLWIRPFGSASGRTIPGTEGAMFPFWSPDGESIGFFADGKLKRIDVDSQAIGIVADAPVPRGGAWQADGTILFAPSASGPLFRVPATGGQPAAATHLEQGQNDHRAPIILPGGRHVLYYARGTPQVRGVYVARLDGSDSKRLLDADAAAVYASGHLLFVRQGELFARPFDATRPALTGAPFRVEGRVSVNPGLSLASLAASASGTIAYGSGSIRRTQFTWLDRSGKQLETVGPPDQTNFATLALSPDGRQIAFSRGVDRQWDIWLMDTQGAMSQFSSNLPLAFNPVWLPDGRRILFQSGGGRIYSRSVNDSAPAELLVSRDEFMGPTDVSPDGRVLLYNRSPGPPSDLWYVSLVGDRTLHSFVETPFEERDGQFSPDGKWVAYQSNESGHNEIYLQPFPGPGDRIQVSSGGGQQARWGRRTGELFYIGSDSRLTAVPVTFAATGKVTLGQAVPLFRTEFEAGLFQTRQQYAVSADGERFLVNALTDAIDPPSIALVLNWKGKP
jgi:serine/threonine protein kinase